MSTSEQLREGMGRAWESLQEGWQHLLKRTAHALTRFNPSAREAPDQQVELAAPRWGLLAAEVRETEDGLLVRLEAPGMDESDFEIETLDDVLVIRGEKRIQREGTQGHYHIMECAYGRFERAVPLGMKVDPGRASASYAKGVLSVRLPRHRSAGTRRITVESR